MSIGLDGGEPLGAPVFIIGAPRSGTTYLQEVLNRHPQILITNETRIMIFINRMTNRLEDRRLNWYHREEWKATWWKWLPMMIEDYYRQLGALPGMRWGDKYPHYADPKTDPNCLTVIDSLFPTSQFVDIVRNGRDVAASIAAKQWQEVSEALDVWERHVHHASAFAGSIGTERMIRIRYEDLRDHGQSVIRDVLGFLGLEPAPEVDLFLQDQERHRTPFSNPMSDLRAGGAPLRLEGTLPPSTRDLLRSLGY